MRGINRFVSPLACEQHVPGAIWAAPHAGSHPPAAGTDGDQVEQQGRALWGPQVRIGLFRHDAFGEQSSSRQIQQ